MIYPEKLNRVAIIGSNRIPFARSNGAYIDISNKEMLAAAIQGLVTRYGLKGMEIGEVAAGAVLKHSRDYNLARESVLETDLSPLTPACDIQQACDTGLESAVYIANKIALGQIEVGIAGGTDTVSDAPIAVNDQMRRIFLEVNRGKTTMDKLKALLKLRLKHLAVAPPNSGEPRTKMSMGQHAQIAADVFGIDRTEQDSFALESHKKFQHAYDRGFMDDLITEFKGLKKDNNLRTNTTIEKMAQLGSVFGGSGSMTAANSTPFTDGASAVLLASESWAKANNMPILAYLTHAQLAAVEFVNNKENLLMAPVVAMHKMLTKATLKLQDFDFFEIHEAFASQTLATIKVWESETLSQKHYNQSALGTIDRTKLNVNGSSLAAGHPFAATGGRILGATAKLLNEKGSGKAVISICAAGGQGLVAILEK